jgi:hypothetical protein
LILSASATTRVLPWYQLPRSRAEQSFHQMNVFRVALGKMPSYPRLDIFFRSVLANTNFCSNDAFRSLIFCLFKKSGLDVFALLFGHFEAAIKEQVKRFAMDNGSAIFSEHL